MSSETQIEPWILQAVEWIYDRIVALPLAKGVDMSDIKGMIAHGIAAVCPRFQIATIPEASVTAPLHCPVCKSPLKLNIPATIPFNSGKVSLLAVAHKPTRCQCGRVYVPFLTGANLQCALAEIKPESSIVMASALPQN